MNDIENEHLKVLRTIFLKQTEKFNLTDWRTVRNKYYWCSDKMPTIASLTHKLKCIKHYINKGIPLVDVEPKIHLIDGYRIWASSNEEAYQNYLLIRNI